MISSNGSSPSNFGETTNKLRGSSIADRVKAKGQSFTLEVVPSKTAKNDDESESSEISWDEHE